VTSEANKPDPVNILLVDDQPARLMSYRLVLEPLGERLVEATSGTQALARLMAEEFAVILLDINMPGMDGFETASLIHQHPRFEKTPIIFVTAVNISDMDRLRGYDLGAVDYVTVPVIPEILRGKVMVLGELFRKRRDLQVLNRSLADANEALRVEKAREVHKLNETLQQAIAELEAEAAVRRRTEETLMEANRRKDEFLATLAHELRNPLAPIQSALNVHRLEPDPAARLELVGIIDRQVRLLTRMVEDLLDVARITRGKLDLRRQQVSARELLDAAIESARPMIDASGHQLHANFVDGDLRIFADGQRLSQVFANLLNNACKYTSAGGTIWLESAQRDGQLVVSIRDNGIGLDPEQAGRIFDLFVQVDSSLERTRAGLGIGLTLARQFVGMHGGEISVSSEGPGKGSEFTVRLPIENQAPVAADEPQASREPARDRRMRILIVDDNRDGADMLALTLEILGHEVLTLYDPLKAVEAAEAFRPDLALLDIGMPTLNGYELAKLMRSQPWGADLLLVALTGWGQEENRQQSASAGFDRHLVKPIDLETIREVCEWAQRGSAATQPSSGSRVRA
jgi:signal transduction histidine kinase